MRLLCGHELGQKILEYTHMGTDPLPGDRPHMRLLCEYELGQKILKYTHMGRLPPKIR
jgi:hypothetical protein